MFVLRCLICQDNTHFMPWRRQRITYTKFGDSTFSHAGPSVFNSPLAERARACPSELGKLQTSAQL